MEKSLLNAKVRAYRARTNNASTHKYERTINGFLMRKYRNMQSRINGIQKVKYHLYKGKDLLDRQTFYLWSKSDKAFNRLYKEWVLNNYSRKLCPSVDRINSNDGYHLSNMEWITHSENSRRGSNSNWSRRRYSPNLQETVRSRQ